MTEHVSSRDRALDQLTSEFPGISARIVVKVFLGYLETSESLSAAVAATRARIIDACVAV